MAIIYIYSNPIAYEDSRTTPVPIYCIVIIIDDK